MILLIVEGRGGEPVEFQEPEELERKVDLLLNDAMSNYKAVLQDNFGGTKYADERCRVDVAELKLDIKPLYENITEQLEEMKQNEKYEYKRFLQLLRIIIRKTGEIHDKARDKLRLSTSDESEKQYIELLNGAKLYLKNAKKGNVLVRFAWG